MRIEHEPPFPTPGRMLLSLLKYSGLWEFLPKDERKKSVQRELERFASEEKILPWARIEALVQGTVLGAIGHEALAQITSRALTFFMTNIQREVVGNATWFPRKETVRWLIRHSVLVPLTLAVHRAILLYGSGGRDMDVLYFPDDPLWFLPSQTSEGGTESPVPRLMNWWLTENDFDSPEQFAEKTCGRLSVSAIRNWLSGRSVPEIGTLLSLNECNLGLGAAEKDMKRSLVVCLLIARTTQGIYGSLTDLFGDSETDLLLTEYRRLHDAFAGGEAKAIASALAELEHASLDEREEFVHHALGSVLHGIVRDHAAIHGGRHERGGHTGGAFQTAALATVLGSEELPPPDIRKIIEVAMDLQRITLPVGMTDLVTVRAKLSELASLTSASGTLEWFIPLYEARLAIREGELEKASGLYIKAFKLARYRGGAYTEAIVGEAMSLSCHLYTKACDGGAPRGEVWKQARYLRDWALLNEICPGIVDRDDREFTEKARRYFEETFGKWVESVESPAVTRHGEHTGFLHSPTLAFAPDWKPNFRHPSRVVKDCHIRDLSQLMLAVLCEKEEWALHLIELGADLSFSNTTGDNAFTYAMTRQNWPARYAVANAILDRDIPLAALQTPTKRLGNTALMLILAHRRPDLLEKLLTRGCDPNTEVPFQGQDAAPLCIAVCCLARPWVWGPEGVGFTATELGVDRQSGTIEDGLDALRQLIGAGADVNRPMGSDQTALSLAVELGLASAVSVLLDHGADPNVPGRGGLTPLCQAVAVDAVAIAGALVEHGAWCDVSHPGGRLLIDHCASSAMSQLLLEGVAGGNCRSVIL